MNDEFERSLIETLWTEILKLCWTCQRWARHNRSSLLLNNVAFSTLIDVNSCPLLTQPKSLRVMWATLDQCMHTSRCWKKCQKSLEHIKGNIVWWNSHCHRLSIHFKDRWSVNLSDNWTFKVYTVIVWNSNSPQLLIAQSITSCMLCIHSHSLSGTAHTHQVIQPFTGGLTPSKLFLYKPGVGVSKLECNSQSDLRVVYTQFMPNCWRDTGSLLEGSKRVYS